MISSGVAESVAASGAAGADKDVMTEIEAAQLTTQLAKLQERREENQ